MMGYFQVLGAATIWAFFNGVLVKWVKTSGVGVGAWTGLVGMVMMAAVFLVTGARFVLSEEQLIAVIFLMTAATINNACYYTAIKMAGVVNAALFHYLAPMLVMVWNLTIPTFYAPVSFPHILALLVGLAGIIYVGMPSLGGSKLWILFGLGSAVFYSLEIVLSGYVMNNLQVSSEIATFGKLFGQAVLMAVIAVIFNEKLSVETRNDWRKLLWGGVLLYISFILYFEGSKTVGDLERGVMGYIDRIGAIVLGAYAFEEKLTKNIVIGGTLVIGASVLLFF
ncbi:MAG: hypothetical protein A3J46_02145 [Candidatus Yanofskybacteria bacterium RIFCSPHIGHO2_02_FULL_41_11]|uniref:EamA domain-containing protein n=1 Tax=Candidatus Yanofskybacteria bacterium RIFCSPHIGHO2_02_FULL_41_11 TaxID=1802675 RepID=A0A1F8FB72_9BACT|nr:MAG: hypothetical protein A3J46_02145 [Candidatus Yanofskybacteria bacterium RIFCSPHIGHO2_02_FULL_41_11]